MGLGLEDKTPQYTNKILKKSSLSWNTSSEPQNFVPKYLTNLKKII